jgi:CBS domain-containing protein
VILATIEGATMILTENCTIREIMNSPVLSISSQSTLLQAALTIRRTGYRHLAIVDQDRLVGILTERDVNRFAPSLLSKVSQEEYNEIFEKTPIERVMTRNPMTVGPETSVREAAHILQVRKIGCLPVVENDRLVGIVTVTDMLRVLQHLLGGKAPALSVEEV